MNTVTSADSSYYAANMNEKTEKGPCLAMTPYGVIGAERVKSFPSSKIKHFTGLPSFVTLMAVFNFIAPLVPNNSGSTLSKFQQFLMVLMILRLNLGNQCLAHRFNIHNSTVSRNFKKWIDVMYLRLKPLIKRTACDELLITMPMSSRKNLRPVLSL